MDFSIEPFGYSTLLIKWDTEIINRTLLSTITTAYKKIASTDFPGLIDINTGYNSIAISFAPSLIPFLSLEEIIKEILFTSSKSIANNEKEPSKTWIIEVDYRNSLDLENVAAATSLSTSDVVQIHSQIVYDVHFIGFLPGFLYLGGLDKRLFIERLSTPRTLIPAGAVAIAGHQTGIYPTSSPGGWHIIGQTDFNLFDPHCDQPMQIMPGDKVKFQAYQHD